MAAAVGYVALAASVASAAVSAYSSYEQGQSQKAAMAYQAQVAKNNQDIADQYAQMELAKGRQLEETKRLATAQQEGAIRAAAGASGLDPNAGSPVRLQEDTARVGEEDALTIRANAARAAYGYKVQGMNYAAQAQLDEMGSQDAARAGSLGAFSSILSGASSVGDKWARYKAAGVWS
jgi:hypothetical protein